MLLLVVLIFVEVVIFHYKTSMSSNRSGVQAWLSSQEKRLHFIFLIRLHPSQVVLSFSRKCSATWRLDDSLSLSLCKCTSMIWCWQVSASKSPSTPHLSLEYLHTVLRFPSFPHSMVVEVFIEGLRITQSPSTMTLLLLDPCIFSIRYVDPWHCCSSRPFSLGQLLRWQ